jgi:hypothetical protein
MKKLRLIQIFVAFSLVAGCRSAPQVAMIVRETSSPTTDAVAIRPQSRSSGNSPPTLRSSETVKVYGLNRYIDPGDSKMMHERHAIYRIEYQPSWVTRSPKVHPEILLGPVLGLKKLEYTPEPQPGETSRELMQARRGLEEANRNVHTVAENETKLANSLAALAKQNAVSQQKTTEVLSYLNDRVKHLEQGNEGAVSQMEAKE